VDFTHFLVTYGMFCSFSILFLKKKSFGLCLSNINFLKFNSFTIIQYLTLKVEKKDVF